MDMSCMMESIEKYQVPDKDCVLPLLSTFLGYAIVASSIFLKVPQIYVIVKNKSIKGLSVASFELEVAGFTIALAYCLFKQLPFSAYGEVFFILIQSIVCLALIYYYSPTHGAGMWITTALYCEKFEHRVCLLWNSCHACQLCIMSKKRGWAFCLFDVYFLCRACHSSINVKETWEVCSVCCVFHVILCLACQTCHSCIISKEVLSIMFVCCEIYVTFVVPVSFEKKFGQCVCLLCITCHVWHSCIIFQKNWAIASVCFLFFPRHVDQNRTLLRIGAHSHRRELGAYPIRNPIRMPTRHFLRGEVTPDLRKLPNQEHGTIELHDKFHVIRRLRCSNVHKHPGECAYEHVGRLFAWLAHKRCRLCTNRRVCSQAWECRTIEGEGEENGVSTCFEFLSWGFRLEELP